MMTIVRRFLMVVACAGASACGGDDSTRPAPPDGLTGLRSADDVDDPAARSSAATPEIAAPTGTDPAATSPSGFADKVKFTGTSEFAIKPMDDGAKLVDADGQEIARYTILEELRVKVKDARDRGLGQIKGSSAKMHVEDADGERRFALQRQPDGDYKLEDAAGDLICKLQRRDYGWKLENAAGEEIAKVKTKSGKTWLRDPEDVTVLSTRGEISPLAMACLALDVIEQPLRIALAIRIQAEGN